MNPALKEKLKLLPDQPGVYRFFGEGGRILYIGKAKNLKNRVRTYFNPGNLEDPRIEHLVPQIQEVEWIVTHTETESLILEEQLIKKHQPKFNINLKDDKSYPYFKLSIQELFPRLELVRKIHKDGSLYFGPYTSVLSARRTEKVIRKSFPLRQSKMKLDGTKKYRPCLNYQMGRCLAPCAEYVDVAQYGQMVQKVLQVLKGNYEELISKLKEEMFQRSERMEYEIARDLRDQIQALEQTLQKQRVVSPHKLDQDILAVVREGGFAGVQILFVRGGILLSDDFLFVAEGENYEDAELLRSALSKLYVKGGNPLPKEILLPLLNESLAMLEGYFSEQRGSKVELLVPHRGDKRSLLQMAQKNGEENLKIKMQQSQADDLILSETQDYLKLRHKPKRVECFDISNTQGKSNVASMVVFAENHPAKADYRKYKIRSLAPGQANDFQAMEEVLIRRYSRLIEEGGEWPDLILIDGGKGQLASAVQALLNLRAPFERFDIIGLAKGRSEQRRGAAKEDLDFEYVVKPNQKNPLPLKANSKTLHFLQRIRDEAHRFAISFHRSLRGQETLTSQLEAIAGIGPKKRKALLQHFGSLTKIKGASLEELVAVPGISGLDAQAILEAFGGEGSLGEEKDE